MLVNSVFYENFENKITKKSTDDDLKKVSKEFEAYFVEQMLKQMEKLSWKDEKTEGEYTKYFKDLFYKDLATEITKDNDFGIAKIMYESMKTSRNLGDINE